jgi:hypothetical protein
MQRSPLGGHVQRVSVARVASHDVAVLAVRVPGETLHVVVAGGLGVGTVDAPGRARLRVAMTDAASPGQARCQARLEGGRVVHVSDDAIEVAQDGQTWRLSGGSGGALTIAQGGAGGDAPSLRALEVEGARIAEELEGAAGSGRRQALRRALAKAAARIERRIQAVHTDLARTAGADAMARRAQLFVAAASCAARGATKLTAIDWSSGEARTLAMDLDPARGAREQIDALFRRARRLKDGPSIAHARLAEAEKALARLSEVSAELTATDGPDIDALVARARGAAPHDFKLDWGAKPGSARARRQAPLPPYRTLLAATGARILVGRGAAHNDALTLRVARPHDLWLHAKGRAGAHVVVPLEKGASCPPDVLVEAAHLAAHFSEARGERVVEVQYAPRRHVRKPRGSAPGLVVVDREKVIVLRVQSVLLKGLLEREVATE